MKSRIAAILILTFTLAPLRAMAQEAVDLDELMLSMKAHFSELSKEPTPAAAAGLRDDIRQALAHLPPKVEALDEPQRAKVAVEYRKLMGQMLLLSLDLELHTLNGKKPEALAVLQEIAKLRQNGHKLFK